MAKSDRLRLLIKVEGINDTIKEVRQIRKIVNRAIVQDGLDDILQKDLKILKTFLLNSINTLITEKFTIDKETIKLSEKRAELPKSQEEFFKFITGEDYDQIIQQPSSYVTEADNKVIITNVGRIDQEPTLRVDLELWAKPGETYMECRERAVKAFDSKMFVYLESGSNPKYYLRATGESLRPWIKIRCSSAAQGRTDADKYRYDMQNSRNPQFMLYHNKLKQIINQKGFIDLEVEVVDKVLNGRYDDAIAALEKTKNFTSFNVDTWIEKINQVKEHLSSDEIEKLEGAPQDGMLIHAEMIALINNLAIKKRKTKQFSEYSLVSTFTKEPDTEVEFWTEFMRIVSQWKVAGANLWYKDLRDKAAKILRQPGTTGLSKSLSVPFPKK